MKIFQPSPSIKIRPRDKRVPHLDAVFPDGTTFHHNKLRPKSLTYDGIDVNQKYRKQSKKKIYFLELWKKKILLMFLI